MMVMMSHNVGDIVTDLVFKICGYGHFLSFLNLGICIVDALYIEDSIIHFVILINNLIRIRQLIVFKSAYSGE